MDTSKIYSEKQGTGRGVQDYQEKVKVEKQEGEVISQITSQDKMLCILMDTLSQMEERFRYVMRIPNPCGKDENKEPQASCELAEILGRHNRRIEEAVSFMKEMLFRCQL